jgi:hypothetical protein
LVIQQAENLEGALLLLHVPQRTGRKLVHDPLLSSILTR